MKFIHAINQPRWPTVEWALNEVKIYLSAAALSAIAFFVICLAVLKANLLLENPGNAAIVAWIGVGIVAAAGAVWTIAQWFAKKPSEDVPAPNVSAERGALAAGRDIPNVTIVSDTAKAKSSKGRIGKT